MYEETSGVSLVTLIYMRNEILAQYGYRFKATDNAKTFTSSHGYSPKYDSIEEFTDQLSEIDNHNLAFLEKIIGLIKNSSV